MLLIILYVNHFFTFGSLRFVCLLSNVPSYHKWKHCHTWFMWSVYVQAKVLTRKAIPRTMQYFKWQVTLELICFKPTETDIWNFSYFESWTKTMIFFGEYKKGMSEDWKVEFWENCSEKQARRQADFDLGFISLPKSKENYWTGSCTYKPGMQ